jgi:NDP-sugar pyrophosphorylase family protein
MEAVLGAVSTGLDIHVSREPELMGTAGGIALARDRGLLAGEDPLLVINGDGMLNLSLEPLVERMASSDDLVSLALLPHLDPARWSRVGLDCDGAVTGIKPPGPPERGEVPLLFPGVMLVSREALAGIPVTPGDIPERLWRPALDAGRLGGTIVPGHWREVGTPTDYLQAVLDRINGGRMIDPSARIDPDAAIGSALIGRDVRIEAGAVIGEAVLAEGVVVGRGARVLRSVLIGGAVVRPDEVVTGEFRAGSS